MTPDRSMYVIPWMLCCFIFWAIALLIAGLFA